MFASAFRFEREIGHLHPVLLIVAALTLCGATGCGVDLDNPVDHHVTMADLVDQQGLKLSFSGDTEGGNVSLQNLAEPRYCYYLDQGVTATINGHPAVVSSAQYFKLGSQFDARWVITCPFVRYVGEGLPWTGDATLTFVFEHSGRKVQAIIGNPAFAPPPKVLNDNTDTSDPRYVQYVARANQPQLLEVMTSGVIDKVSYDDREKDGVALTMEATCGVSDPVVACVDATHFQLMMPDDACHGVPPPMCQFAQWKSFNLDVTTRLPEPVCTNATCTLMNLAVHHTTWVIFKIIQ